MPANRGRLVCSMPVPELCTCLAMYFPNEVDLIQQLALLPLAQPITNQEIWHCRCCASPSKPWLENMQYTCAFNTYSPESEVQ